MYTGGRLWHDGSTGLLQYQSGRTTRTTKVNGQEQWMNFTNTLVYLCNVSEKLTNGCCC